MSRTVTVAGRTAGGGEGSSASGASKSHLSERGARSLRGIGVGGDVEPACPRRWSLEGRLGTITNVSAL